MTDTAGDHVTQAAKQTAQLIRERDGRAALHSAAALGQQARLAEALAADPARVNDRMEDGKTPLHLAAQWGQLEAAGWLLERGADARAQDREGRTPLHGLSGHATRLDLLDLLVAHGADVNAADRYGNTPLFLAASQIHLEGFDWGAHDWLAESLLKHGARLDAFTAVILNRVDELRSLVAADPDLLAARKRHGYIPDGSTLLHFAADRGNTEAARLLVGLGADVNATDRRGRPPLYVAGHKGGARKRGPSPEIVALLLAAGAPLDVFAAALLGRMEALAGLVEAGTGRASATDEGGNTALHLAAWNGQTEGVDWLARAGGAEVDTANARGETPLALAAAYGHHETVEALFRHGARASVFTAIQLARPDLLEAALGADPAAATRPNRYGRTPVQMATEAMMWAHTMGNATAEAQQKDNLARLRAHGAPQELWAAAVLAEAEVMTRLLAENPGRVNEPDNGNTPLHLAAVMGHAAMAELLIGHGAALEARDFAGATPLRRAVGFIPGTGRGDAETVEVLLRHGANRDARNNWNDTPYAVALGTPAVAEVLLAHGAELNIWAAALDRRDALAAALAADPASVHAVGPFGFTPVTWAVVNGQTGAVAYLLDQGAELDTQTWGRSLLAWALACGRTETADLLRQRELSA